MKVGTMKSQWSDCGVEDDNAVSAAILLFGEAVADCMYDVWSWAASTDLHQG